MLIFKVKISNDITFFNLDILVGSLWSFAIFSQFKKFYTFEFYTFENIENSRWRK